MDHVSKNLFSLLTLYDSVVQLVHYMYITGYTSASNLVSSSLCPHVLTNACPKVIRKFIGYHTILIPTTATPTPLLIVLVVPQTVLQGVIIDLHLVAGKDVSIIRYKAKAFNDL